MDGVLLDLRPALLLLLLSGQLRRERHRARDGSAVDDLDPSWEPETVVDAEIRSSSRERDSQ